MTLSRIWTQVADSYSYNDNRFTKQSSAQEYTSKNVVKLKFKHYANDKEQFLS